MTNPLSKFSEPLFALLRIVAGFLFACHGAQKLFGILGGERAAEPLIVFAGVIEFGGGLLLVIGLLTTVAAFLASGEMAFAYFISHAPAGFFPILNRGDAAILYCFIFLYIAFAGGGPWSVDVLMGRKASPQ